MRVRGGVFLGAGLGVGILLPVGVDKSRSFREVWIIAYWVVVVTAASCSSVEFLLVEADVRESNWLTSCSIINLLFPLRPWELRVPGKIPWYRCAKAAVSKVSGWPVNAMDSRSRASWGVLKKFFHSCQSWFSIGFPSQVGRSRGKYPAFSSM